MLKPCPFKHLKTSQMFCFEDTKSKHEVSHKGPTKGMLQFIINHIKTKVEFATSHDVEIFHL